ncbi:hypothetical protein ACFL6C_10275 [Myxococcota bacterium]
MRFDSIKKFVEARKSEGLDGSKVNEIVDYVKGAAGELNKRKIGQLQKVADLFGPDFTDHGAKILNKLLGGDFVTRPSVEAKANRDNLVTVRLNKPSRVKQTNGLKELRSESSDRLEEIILENTPDRRATKKLLGELASMGIELLAFDDSRFAVRLEQFEPAAQDREIIEGGKIRGVCLEPKNGLPAVVAINLEALLEGGGGVDSDEAAKNVVTTLHHEAAHAEFLTDTQGLPQTSPLKADLTKPKGRKVQIYLFANEFFAFRRESLLRWDDFEEPPSNVEILGDMGFFRKNISDTGWTGFLEVLFYASRTSGKGINDLTLDEIMSSIKEIKIDDMVTFPPEKKVEQLPRDYLDFLRDFLFALNPHWLAQRESPSPMSWIYQEYQKRGVDTEPLVDAMVSYAEIQTYDATLSTLMADFSVLKVTHPKVVSFLAKKIESEDVVVHSQAVASLLSLDSQHARRSVMAYFVGMTNEQSKAKLFRAIERISRRDGKWMELFLPTLTRPSHLEHLVTHDWRFRRSRSEGSSKPAFHTLLKWAQNDAPPKMQEAVIGGLEYSFEGAPERVVDFLTGCTSSASKGVKKAAKECLESIRHNHLKYGDLSAKDKAKYGRQIGKVLSKR